MNNTKTTGIAATIAGTLLLIAPVGADADASTNIVACPGLTLDQNCFVPPMSTDRDGVGSAFAVPSTDDDAVEITFAIQCSGRPLVRYVACAA